jgi:hypothetical protein
VEVVDLSKDGLLTAQTILFGKNPDRRRGWEKLPQLPENDRRSECKKARLEIIESQQGKGPGIRMRKQERGIAKSG